MPLRLLHYLQRQRVTTTSDALLRPLPSPLPSGVSRRARATEAVAMGMWRWQGLLSDRPKSALLYAAALQRAPPHVPLP